MSATVHYFDVDSEDSYMPRNTMAHFNKYMYVCIQVHDVDGESDHLGRNSRALVDIYLVRGFRSQYQDTESK